MHQTYLSVHHLTESNLPIIADYLCKRKVKYYAGYPSAIYLIARHFLENRITLSHPPRVITTGSETLLPHQRMTIEKAFNSEVADFYGASEHCGNISECDKHSYHVDCELGIIEFVEMDNMPNNLRHMICTGFYNMAMPLIRYKIGDIAGLSKKSCDCGRQTPIIDNIDGRIESYIITPDGRQLGRLDFLFKNSEKIEEAQLIQHEISSVTIKIVRSPEYDRSAEKSLMYNIRRYLGNEIVIKFDYVSAIPREPNGKFRQILSSIFPGK